MSKLSDAVNEIKEILSKKGGSEPGQVKTAGGQGKKDPQDELVMAAIGGLFGKPEANKEQPIVAYIKANKQKTDSKSIGELIIGLRGGLDESVFNKMMENKKTFFDELVKTKFTDKFKKFADSAMKFMGDDATWLKEIKKTLEEQNKKEEEEKSEAELDVKGGTDFEKVLKAISEFKIDKDTEESLKKLADMTGKDGCITVIFDNINNLNKKNVNFDAFSENMKKMDKAAKESAEVGEKVDEGKMKKSAKGMVSFSDMLLGVIVIGGLFIIVGLLGNLLDYASIFKFGAALLLFLLGLIGVFLLANNMLKKGGGVTEGMDSFIKLVIVSSFILILGSIVMKWIDFSDIMKFTGSLLIFLLMLTGVYAIMNAVAKNTMTGVKDFMIVVIASAGIMILGALFNKFIPFEDVIGFTLKLGLFLLMLAGIFFVWTLAKIVVGKGIRDAIIAVGMAAFIMFLGALTARFIKWEDLARFLFMLGSFIFGILIVMFVASMALKVEKGLIAETVLLVVAATFVMFLGTLALEYIKVEDVLAFTGLLSLFIGSILLVIGLISLAFPQMKIADLALKDLAIFVGTMAAIMLIGALTMKFVGIWSTLEFIGLFGLFMWGILGEVLTPILIAWKPLKIAELALKDVAIFVGSMAAVLVIGSLAMEYIDLWSALKFIGLFALFLWGVIGKVVTPLLLSWKSIKIGELALKDLAIFIGAMAATMLVGALVLKLFPDLWFFVLEFLGLFTLFLKALSPIINDIIEKQKDIEEGNKGMKDLGIFVAIAGATLCAGGLLLIFFPDLIWSIPVFGTLLGIFVWAMVKVMSNLAKKQKTIESGNRAMKELGIFVAMAAGVLAAGGLLLVFFPDLIWAIPVFGTMLWGFVAAMVKVMKKLAKDLKKSEADNANSMLRSMSISLAIISGCFLILSVVYAIVNKSGGVAKFLGFMAVVLGTIAIMVEIMKTLAKQRKDNLKKAEIAMGVIAGVLVVVSLAFAILAKVYDSVMKAGGLGKFTLLVLLVVGTIGILSVGIAALGMLLGTVWAQAVIWPAIAVVLAATAAFLMVAVGIEKIAHALEVLSKIKKFDVGPLVDACKDMVDVIDALAPIMDKKWVIIAVADVVDELAYTISKMAEAVKEYADLKIKVYKGTEHVGYRSLKRSDFKQASKNVSYLVTTLTEGIMQAYEAHPEWYGGINWNLSGGDFINAIFNSMGDETPLEKVIRQSLKLAPLISKIAETVKEYADLKVKTYTGVEHTGYKELKKSDFKKAAQNVTLTIVTLTEGIMKAYEEHPDWYGDLKFDSLENFFVSLWRTRGDESPLERVIRQNMKLAPLISKIAEAVEEVANLKFATKWDDEGKPIKYKIMKKADFKNAGANTALTVTTLTQALMDVYEAHPDWYGGLNFNSVGDFVSSVFSSLSSQTPLEKVVTQSMKLAPLITAVAEALSNYAELKFPSKWDDNGKPIKFKVMKNKDFDDAGRNVSMVLTTITNELMTLYDQHADDWYDDGIFSDSDLVKVIKVNTKITELISNVADSIQKYAQLLIPDKWNKDGQVIHSHPMTPDEFQHAGDNIGKILTATTMSVMGFDVNGNDTSARSVIQKYILDDDDDFETILEHSEKIGTLISGMADSISKYAQLMIPDKWDRKTGTPIHFTRMTGQMMADAGEGIGKIIVCVAQSLADIWEQKPEVFGWDPEEEEFRDDAPITHVIDSCVNMGSVISGIADGLIKYAEFRVPKRWNKEGQPISFEKVDQGVFTKAAANVGAIVTVLGQTFISLYESNPSMFQTRVKSLAEALDDQDDDTRSPFEIVTDASTKMAAVIGDIAKSLTMFADKKVVHTDKDGKNPEIVQITDETLKLAQDSVTKVLVNVADTFVKLSKPPYSTYFSDETIEQIVEPIGAMMQVVGTMSTSLQSLAQLRIPIKWGEDGNPTDYRIMNTGDFIAAGINIRLILSALGDAFLNVATDPRASWVTGAKEIKQATKDWMGRSFTETVQTESEGNDITPVIEGMSALATVLQIISGCIFGYATMRFPNGTDKDGNVTYCQPLTDEDLRKCKENIVLVVSTLGQAMQDITQAEAIKWLTSEENEDLIDDVNGAVTNVIEFLQSCVDALKGFVDSEGVQAIKKIQTTFDNIIPVMKNIISDIGTLLKLFFDGNGLSANKDSSDGPFKIEITSSSFYIILHAYEEYIDELPNKFKAFTDMLTDICTTLQDMTDPIKDAMPSINELHKIFTKDKFNDKLKLIIVNIADMLTSISKIGELDKLFIIDINTEGTGVGNNSFGGLMKQLKGAGQLDGEDRENVNKAVDKLKSRMEVYTDLMIYVIQKLRSVNDNLSSLQVIDGSVFGNAIGNFFGAIKVIKNELEGTSMFDVMSISMMISGYSWALEKLISTIEKTKNIGEANFSTLTGGIVAINRALAGINQKTLNNFKQQNAQIDKLVKIINSTKLINLIQLNAFANSMNKLAAKMGNLDKLTEAISNKLTTVLEKLVKRLEHAEATIVKADEIQKRRHELIQKATQEVKSLMETPMKVEIAPSADMAAMSQASTATDTTTTTDSSAETAATQENNGQKKTDDKSKTTTDTKKTSGS